MSRVTLSYCHEEYWPVYELMEANDDYWTVDITPAFRKRYDAAMKEFWAVQKKLAKECREQHADTV